MTDPVQLALDKLLISCLQDDWYNGYFIPEGTFCFSNVT